MSTLYEARCENMMCILGNNDRNVESCMATVHELLLYLRHSVDVVHARTQTPSVTDPPE